ncbi:phosphatidylserine decarboxylase [Nematocida parisii]|nr:phosphatidylserine decarboxylase [Nematocida parisii]
MSQLNEVFTAWRPRYSKYQSKRFFKKTVIYMAYFSIFIVFINVLYDKFIQGETTIKYSIIRTLPLRTYSRVQGWMCKIYLPWPGNVAVLAIFKEVCRISLEDAERQKLSEYSSVNDLFTRKLKRGIRPIQKGIISPVDGTIICMGDAKDSANYKIKGAKYKIEDLLGDPSIWRRIDKNNTLKQAVIYLAPHNYHRFHSFTDFTITDVLHLPSLLFSVGELTMKYFPGLLAKNERVVFSGQYMHGYCAMVAVGSVGVGSISSNIAEFKTNRMSGLFTTTYSVFSGSRVYKKGEEIGLFNLGSTVVIVFECPKEGFVADKVEGPVRLGESLGNFEI